MWKNRATDYTDGERAKKYMNGISIIFEDDYIIVLNKPSGAPTHMLRADETGTVVNFLLDHCPEIRGVGTNDLMSGLAHRLDTDTSGVVLAVKDNESFKNIRQQFREHKVIKEYLALVHGRYDGPKVISNFIGNDPKKKKKVRVYPKEEKGARPAVTEINEIMYYGNYALLTLNIKTGVRHQIRAHLAYLGYPIVGDKIYQTAKMRESNPFGLNRHFLHASKIGFSHPATNKHVVFTSPLPEELNGILKKCSER